MGEPQEQPGINSWPKGRSSGLGAAFLQLSWKHPCFHVGACLVGTNEQHPQLRTVLQTAVSFTTSVVNISAGGVHLA